MKKSSARYSIIIALIVLLLLIAFFVPIKSGTYPRNMANCYPPNTPKRRTVLTDGFNSPRAADIGPFDELCGPYQPAPQYHLYLL